MSNRFRASHKRNRRLLRSRQAQRLRKSRNEQRLIVRERLERARQLLHEGTRKKSRIIARIKRTTMQALRKRNVRISRLR